MYTLSKNGKELSQHLTYREACKQARLLSSQHPKAYFTVHEGNDPEAKGTHRYTANGNNYLPEYIVRPQSG